MSLKKLLFTAGLNTIMECVDSHVESEEIGYCVKRVVYDTAVKDYNKGQAKKRAKNSNSYKDSYFDSYRKSSRKKLR